jgi:hypothetical protein
LDAAERFSRQVILPGVGVEGQARWARSGILLDGEGPALESAATALASAGIGELLLPSSAFDAASLAVRYPGLKVRVSPERPQNIPKVDFSVIVTENGGKRRSWSRFFRKGSLPALFGWPAGRGWALFLASHPGGACPCLECFEALNPKAFSSGEPAVQRLLGAMAASEALQYLLEGGSVLEGKVWVTSLETGVSFRHPVLPSPKCQARLLEEGAQVTP